ncbi:MAG: penicillin-binding transpeptidase domain-containing protein [Lachnospiraceae bacterium]|nr:penicillin-binding transpeptidase domain-containing protein [Lachnospiraceae bacterium]
MPKRIKDGFLSLISNRLFLFFLAAILLFSILVVRLFKLQIIDGEEYLDNFVLKTKKTITTQGSRGNIYDVNGKLLAYNKLAYTVVMESSDKFAELAEENKTTESYERNKMIYNLIKLLETNGDEIVNDFPIVLTKKGKLKYTVDGNSLTRFLKDVYSITSIESLEKDQQEKGQKLLESSAEETFQFLRTGEGGLTETSMFDISDEYSMEDTLKIMAVRYNVYMNRYSQTNPVTIANDVSEESLIAIEENPDAYPGVSVTTDSLRVYNNSKYFSHIIGYTGVISTDEMDEMNEGKSEDDAGYYDSTDVIGKSGIEQEMEKYLRGTKGKQEVYVNNLGKILQVASSTEASAGNNVSLSIDSDLQKYCYDLLERRIAGIILTKLTSASDGGSEKLIPINDVYFALIDNNVVDIDSLNADSASAHEKSVYSDYVDKRTNIISRIRNQLEDGDKQRNLSDEMQEYTSFIYDMLADAGILNTNLINTSDETYLDWKNDRISLEKFLRYAINKEWIDIAQLDLSSAYYDTEEMYDALVEYITGELENQADFDKLLYKYMIKSGELSGRDVCLLLYDQGVLNSKKDDDYTLLKTSQLSSYEFMQRKIRSLEITPAQLALDPCSGSIVITDSDTGAVKALVSYPSYDNNKLANGIDSDYFASLMEDETRPMYNRATQQKTAPGSTYKPLVAVAALEEGIVDPYTIIDAQGIFTEVTPSPRCWIYPSHHGKINIQQAIGVSCNYFFYEVGYRMGQKNGEYNSARGLEVLTKYAEMFGFDRKSGIELPESTPSISDTDSVRSAIGQGTNSYTPSQISRYLTALASEGNLYNLSILKDVTNADGEVIKSYEPELIEKLSVSDSTWNAVKNGMYQVVYGKNSSIDHLFKPLKTLKIAGKTGTAQENTKRANHALFISYGPYEDPEITVTTVIPFGYTSSYAAETARDVYKYYFDLLTDEEKEDKDALYPTSGTVSND